MQTVKTNRPDAIVIAQGQKKCLLISVAIPAEGNSSVKVKKKTVKVSEIEVARMWDSKRKLSLKAWKTTRAGGIEELQKIRLPTGSGR